MRKLRQYLTAMVNGKKIRFRFTFLVIILLVTLGAAVCEAQNQIPEDVLFVGNSYTYFWNLPQQVHVLAESKGVSIRTSQSTSGGTNWGQHWRSERELESKSLIESGNYDAVVLQNHSMRSIEAKDSLMHYGREFAELIDDNGANTYLYMTWAREWDPYMMDTISSAYMELAREIDATVVPVGLAWQRARELRPDIDLYAEDGSHPSPLGTYLTACVFYRVLTGIEIDSLPPRLISKDYAGEKLYLNILSENNAQFLQKVAEETVTQFETDSDLN